MKCSRSEKSMSPYLDGAVSLEEKHLFEAHMKECRACMDKLDEIGKVRTVFGQAMRYRAPSGFSAQVMEKVRGNAPVRYSFVLLSARVASVVVMLIIIGLGVLTGSLLGSSHQTGNREEAAVFLSLDVFNAVPHDSPGGAYLAMMEVEL